MKFKKILTIGIGESALDAEYWKRIDSLAEKRISLSKDSHEIKKNLVDTDCLLIGFGVNVDREIIDSTPKLKYVGLLATAYDRVDFNYAKNKGIVVSNVPGYSTESVAEFVIAVILEHIRELEKGKRQAREGNYSEGGFSATEIKDKVFGVFGLGRIGSRIAEIALGFGADVRYWSRNRKNEMEKKGVKYEEVNSLISKCDFISLNFSSTEDTKNFLNGVRIEKIKKGAIIVNTAPMNLVDVEALEGKLKTEELIFILDHSDEMGVDELKKLSKYKNCIVYPPIAYISKEARIAKQKIFLENIENFLKGKPINKVN